MLRQRPPPPFLDSLGPGCTRRLCPYCDNRLRRAWRTLDRATAAAGRGVGTAWPEPLLCDHLGQFATTSTTGGPGQFVACIQQCARRSPQPTLSLPFRISGATWGRPCRRDGCRAGMAQTTTSRRVPRLYGRCDPRELRTLPGKLLQRRARGWPRAYTKSGLMVGVWAKATRRCGRCSAISTSTGRHLTDRQLPLTRPEAPAACKAVCEPGAVPGLPAPLAKPEAELPAEWFSSRLTRSSLHAGGGATA